MTDLTLTVLSNPYIWRLIMARPPPFTPFGTTDIVYGGSSAGSKTPGT